MRAALITGGSKGIGLAIARVLGEEGHALTIASRSPGPLDAAAESLRAAGFEVHAVPTDVADEAQLVALVDSHRERHGRLDVLVNNAGVGLGSRAEKQRTERVDLQINVNLRAPVLLYRECLDLLRAAAAERGSALVVNVASMTGVIAQPWLSVYSATKFAVRGLTESMNRELADDGVKSIALCPGLVDTDLSDYIKQQVPPEEMLVPEDIAEGVRFLLRLSPRCVIPEIVFARPGLVV